MLSNFLNFTHNFPDSIDLIFLQSDVIESTRKLNKNRPTCPDPENIPASFIFDIACFLEKPLSHTCNVFLDHAYCPENWTHSIVKPIFKPISSYNEVKPISLTTMQLIENI